MRFSVSGLTARVFNGSMNNEERLVEKAESLRESTQSNAEVWDTIKHLHDIASGHYPVGRPCRVLVVDDNAFDTELLERELRHFNCEVTTANDALVAVDLIKSGRFDVVMLDLLMPKLDGLEVIENTFGFVPGTSFFVVTGYPDSPVLSRALKAGGVVTFMKPVTREKLKVLFPPK